MSEFPDDLDEALERAVDFCARQMANPDVFTDDTLKALSEISAYAAYLRIKGAEYSFRGEKAKGTFIRANVDAMQTIIDSLKYKINANIKTRNYGTTT